MKKYNKNAFWNAKHILSILAVVLVWTLVLVSVVPSVYAATTSNFNVFQLSVDSSEKVEVATTNTGWSVKLYGKTDSGCSGSTNSTVDATLTVTNTGKKPDGSVRAVSFKITTTGTKANDTGAAKTLDATTTSLSYKATSGNGSSAFTTVTIDFADIAQEALGSEIITTVNPGVNGTVTVDGTPVTETTEFTNTDDHYYDLVATPAEGYEFFGWLANGVPLNIDGATSLSYLGTEAKTLTPQFIKAGSAVYIIKGASPVTYYGYLDQAISAANGSGTVVVFKNGKAFASDGSTSFTIPSGVTLLIPFDDAYTVIKDDMKNYVHSPHTDHPAKVQFRSLTLPENHTITVASGGAISVGSRSHNFMVGQTGPYGALYMDNGSNITVQGGANLYAWGYIFYGTGNGGTITVASNANVYENATIMDYTGDAGVANDLYSSGAMPLRTFAFINVEVPMTFNHGGKMVTFYHIYGTIIKNFPGTLDAIGTSSSCVFQIQDANSSVTLGYKNSRQFIETRGNITVNPIVVTLKSLMTIKMDTSQTSGFPLPSFYDVRVVNGTTTMNDNLIFMEGSGITVDRGATVNMNGKNLYVLAAADDPGSQQTGNEKKDVHGVQFSTVSQETKVDINGMLKASGGFYTSAGKPPVISSAGGGVIEVTGTSDKTAVLIKTGTNTTLSVPITPAYLHNANGTTTQIRKDTFTYNGEAGKWQASTHDITEWTEIPATCTTDGSKSGVCSICGETVVDVIPSPGHNMAVATCTEPATCQVEGCGYTEGEPHGHNWLPPTCTSPSVCTYACGTVIDEPLGHSYDSDQEVRVEPTCTEDGYFEQYCMECAYRPREVIPALGHTYDEGVVTKEPTCTETGVKTFTCSVCPEGTDGHIETEEIAALNHDSEGDDDHICNREGCGAAISTCKDNATATSAVVPTCVSGGNSAYWTCGVCGKFYSDADCTAEIAKDSWVLQIDGSAHDWDTVTYSFADDGKACTATHVCKLNGEHKETAEATITPTVSTQATCVAKGKTTYIATFTADWATQQTKIVEDIPATGDHTEATPVVENDVKATCTADGSYDEVVYCTVCKAEVSRETKTTGATGHTEGAAVSEKVVDPTCLAGGSYDSVVYCTVCEAELSREPKTTEATGHEAGEAVTENKVDATCTAVGSYDSVTYCTVCKAEISRKSIEIPMAAHTPGDAVTENKVDATCTVDGSYDTVTYCTVCKKELTRSTTPVTALGHTNGDAVIENKVDATCTEKGSYDSVIYCTVCGAEVSRTPVEVDATDHTSGEAVIENKVDATCTEKGSYDSVVYCTECGVEISRNTITVDEIAHTKGTVQTENVTDPTCTAEGSHDEVIYCTVCGKELSRNTVKDAALGHKGGEPVSENEKAPTCNKKGSYESVIYCSVCSVEVSRTTVEVPATGEHTESAHVVENEVAATCTTDGSYDEVVYCSVCNTELSRSTETVAALGHKNDTPVIENEVAATCTAKGSYDTVVYCTVCNAEQSRVTTTVDALNHKYNAVVTNPTCTVDGYTTYTCDNCGDTYVDDKVAAVGHTKAAPVVENSVDATCDNAGGYDTVVYCTVCGAEVSRVPTTVDALGHKYVGETTAPTCTAAGYTTYTCSVCKDTYTADEVAALGHKYDDGVVTTEPNCTDKGVKTFTCACGDNYTEEVAALGHKYDAVVTAPTCTAAGYTTYTCSVCKHTYTADEVPALGHKYDDGVVTTDPTCTKEGVKTFTCGTCGHSYTEKVEAAGHKYNAVVTAPTCSSGGFTTYTCSTCGDSKTGDNVSKLGHTDVIDEPVAPSCTETGLTEGSHCSVCGEITKAQEVISATGHTSGEVKKENEVPATCTNPGSYNEVTYCSACGEVSSCTTVTVPALNHKDENKDHICDNGCGEPQGEHIAASGSHNCGYCGEKVSGCTDNNGDHNCDVCGEKLSGCADKTGDEDHKCDICGKDDITAHEWTPATYDAPKTCTECGKTLGDPLVRPVEIVKPEYVTAEPSEGITKEEVEKVMSSVVDSIVEAAQKTEQPETGINAEKNKTAVENAKTEIKDKDQNVVTDANYETSLVITLNTVVLDKDEEKVITKKITFDVSPILYALDANGTKIGQTKITSFAEPITFRLPVAENAKAKFARVLHEGVDDLGLYKILTDADGNRFVEVKSKNFSQFSLVLEEECTDHNFVDGQCTICGAEKPVEKVRYTFGQTSQMYLEEPWGVRVNLRVYHAKEDGSKGARLTVTEMSEIDDYGVYFLRERDLTDANATQNTLTVEDIANNPNAFLYSRSNGSVWQNKTAPADGSGNCFTSDFREGIFTYRLSESIFVMYYIVEDGVTYYAPIRERNPSELVNQGINESAYADYDRAILSAMSKLERSSLTYRAQFDSDETLAIMDAPTLAETPLKGTVVEYGNHSFSFGHTQQIIVAEPWGLQFNGKVKLDKEYDDYGVVVYYNNTGNEVSISTAEELLAISDAHIFSVQNGDATLSVQASDGRTVISAIYNSGLYTHQMTEIAYVMFYIQNGDNIYCGPIKERTIQNEIESFLNITKDQIIITLLNDMKELYNKVDAKYEIMGWK